MAACCLPVGQPTHLLSILHYHLFLTLSFVLNSIICSYHSLVIGQEKFHLKFTTSHLEAYEVWAREYPKSTLPRCFCQGLVIMGSLSLKHIQFAKLLYKSVPVHFVLVYNNMSMLVDCILFSAGPPPPSSAISGHPPFSIQPERVTLSPSPPSPQPSKHKLAFLIVRIQSMHGQLSPCKVSQATCM